MHSELFSAFAHNVVQVSPVKLILIICIGALSSMVANKGIAVFNDGLRPLIPEYLEGRMSRGTLAASSFALSFGLIIGFGIPFSLTVSIILIHSLLLGTDIIGIWCKDSKKGFILSGIIGALYGAALLFGLKWIVDIFNLLPVNFMSALGKVGDPIIVCFAIFPALVVGYQYGYKKGIYVLIATALAYFVTLKVGSIHFSHNTKPVALDPNGIALLIAMIVMFYFAIREKPANKEQAGSGAMLVGIFSERIKRIQKNMWLLILSGGLIAMASTMSVSLLAEGPVSLQLMGAGDGSGAFLVSLARAISFIPLVATTAIATGVYSPDGMKFVFVVGLATNNLLVAFIAGCIIMFCEIKLLAAIAIWLDKYPGVKACGDHIRTAITKMMEISLLVGGMVASNAIMPGLGFIIVAGVYLLNRTSKRPLVEMSIGPIATIFVGIIANILYFVA